MEDDSLSVANPTSRSTKDQGQSYHTKCYIVLLDGAKLSHQGVH